MSNLTKRTIEERMEEMRKAVMFLCEALEASRRCVLSATEAMTRFTEMAIEHLERTRE